MDLMVLLKRRDLDMTKGNAAKRIIQFALPLLLGNLFQQLYNMVDTWVIGQTGDNGAYAAVGSVGPIINILIGFFLGLSSGAGVVISQYFGAKQYDKVHKSVHTSLALTLILIVVFTVLGVCFAPFMLDLMLQSGGVESSVYPYAKTYLTIYFAGVAGLMLYNIGAGILRAVGDSARPFLFLVVSAVTNTVLDIVFVFYLDMGVAGVAIATVTAQSLSAVLTLITLLRGSAENGTRLIFRDIRIDFAILARIVKIGFPAALQMALTAFSNVFVQSYIAGVNGVQEVNLGGWTSYSKIDQLVFLPVQSISLSATTFVAQNLGAGDVARAKRGTYISYFMATSMTAVLVAGVMLFAPTLASIFNPDENVVACAVSLLRILTPFYLFTPVNQVFSASLRGAGNSLAPMCIMLGSFVGFRQLYLYIVTSFFSNDLIPVAMSYPAGWGFCCILTLLYFFHYKFKAKA